MGDFDEIPDREHFKNYAHGHLGNPPFALRFAWTSYKIKRSTNSATVLLLGLTGAGKSHTINNFFNKTITPVGELESCTKEIIEFTIEMPSEDMKISNSKLHIIDTPGFGDTSGIEFDAKVMVNLKEFFDRKKYRPNFILLAINVMDKRMGGELKNLIKLVKKQLSGSVLDCDNPNLIVVLTHLCSLPPKQQRDPASQKKVVQQLIEDHCGIRNVPVVFAENCTFEYELDKNGDFYCLPNGELFPRNIHFAMMELAQSIDPLGCGIVNEAYPKLGNCSNEIMKMKHYPIIGDISDSSAVVEEIMKLRISETELGNSLNITWNSLHDSVRQHCRMTPSAVAVKLATLGYKDMKDLPKTKSKTIKLFRDLGPDNGMVTLLRDALGLEAPTLTTDLLIGNGFNVTQDKTTNFKVLRLENLKLSTVGCYFPSNVYATECNEVQFIYRMSNSKEEHIKQRLKDIQIRLDAKVIGFNYEHRDGYNFTQTDCASHMTAVYEKRFLKLEVSSKVDESCELKSATSNLPTTYDKHCEDNVKQWEQFFQSYGTHYISTAYVGGSVTFKVSEKVGKTSSSTSSTHGGGLSGFLREIFGGGWGSSTYESSINTETQKKDFEIFVRGGNSTKASALAQSSTFDDCNKNLLEWESSVMDDPVVTDMTIRLSDIAEHVSKVRPEIVNAMKQAVDDLFQAKLEYEKKQIDVTPPSRAQDSQDSRANVEGGGCLTPETIILTPNGSVQICKLREGDVVLNGEGEPVKVIGVNRVYVHNPSKLYGFKGIDYEVEPFFTNGHTFFHPSGDIMVQNKQVLYRNHPQMKHLFTVQEMPVTAIDLRAFANGTKKTERVDALTSRELPLDQELYFLAVEGPGSYIANGFVCYHELPNFEAWPRTFTTIFMSVRMLNTNADFSRSAFDNLKQVAAAITEAWMLSAKNNDSIVHTIIDRGYEQLITKEEENNDFQQVLSSLKDVLTSPHQVALGMLLYAVNGDLLHDQLDLKRQSAIPYLKDVKRILDEAMTTGQVN